jgi:predicted methyltransferase
MGEIAWPVVLSRFQVERLPRNRETAAPVSLSPDLGLTTVEVMLGPDGLSLPGGEHLDWAALGEIAGSENGCFTIRDGRAIKIQAFSATTNRVCSLMPTAGAPTMLVAGFTMHRIKGCDPYEDGAAKVKAIAPVRGVVLDTATGLGYTAIEATRTATHVHTVEYDPAAQEVARQNPWSRPLFDNPVITQYIGDSDEVVDTFADGMFDQVIHDPPVSSLAGQLYGVEFYRKLHRVLAARGRLFHYVGNPESRSMANVTRGVSERLRAAGFTRVRPHVAAFGVVAEK